MRIPDELLQDLGDYFVHWRIGYAFGLTFEQFVSQYLSGGWQHVHFVIPMMGVE